MRFVVQHGIVCTVQDLLCDLKRLPCICTSDWCMLMMHECAVEVLLVSKQVQAPNFARRQRTCSTVKEETRSLLIWQLLAQTIAPLIVLLSVSHSAATST